MFIIHFNIVQLNNLQKINLYCKYIKRKKNFNYFIYFYLLLWNKSSLFYKCFFTHNKYILTNQVE
jgi:hypothetical protein